jgi:hypothetical protein
MEDYIVGGRPWGILEAWVNGIDEAGWMPTVAHPGVNHVRFYKKGWMTTNPENWAREAAAAFYRETIPGGPRISDLTKHISLWNEANLPDEAGGDTLADLARTYRDFNAWAVRCVREFRNLAPDAVVHFGAFAYGHSDDQDDGGGVIGLEVCREAISLCDVFDHHPYWRTPQQLYDPELAQWYAFRFGKARDVLQSLGLDIPFFLSEMGWMHHGNDPEVANHYDYWFKEVARYPWVLGATPFIWDTGPEHDGQWHYDNVAAIARLDELARTDLSPPEEEPMLPEWIVDMRNQVAFDTGRTRLNLRGITVHHTASRTPIVQYLEAIKRLTEVNYHFLIDEQIYYLNSLDEVVWHAGDTANGPWNREGVAVCFHGLLTGQGIPTQIQQNHFRRLRSWLLDQGMGEEIVSHKAVRDPPGSTQCPGDWWPLGAPVPSILLEPGIPGPSPELVERIERVELTLSDMARILESWR